MLFRSALAADADDVRLSEVLADGWQVQRVLVRRRGGRSTALLFSAADLLRSEGTTAGLLGQAALDLWPGSEVGLQATAGAGDQAVYDVLLDSTGEAGIRSAFDGLEESLTTAVKRSRVMLDRESLQQAAVAIRDWRVESGVLTGAASAEQSAESFVASLEQAGERLPTALAKQQLREAARAALGRGPAAGGGSLAGADHHHAPGGRFGQMRGHDAGRIGHRDGGVEGAAQQTAHCFVGRRSARRVHAASSTSGASP